MNNIVVFFKKSVEYFKSDSGAVIPMAALLFPIIIGMAGIGVDISNWMMFKRQMQTSADAAALAGAWDLANGGDSSSVEAAALKEAKKNWYNDSISGNSIIVTIIKSEENSGDSCDSGDSGDDGSSDSEDSSDNNDSCNSPRVNVEIKGKTDTWFSAYFLSEDIYIGTSATAEVVKSSKFCVLALDDTMDGAITNSGNVTLKAEECGIAVNSNSDSALSFNGSSDVEVGNVKIVGAYDMVGGSVDFSYKKMQTNSSVTKDPYKSLELPSFTACTENQQNAGPSSYTADTTLNPGTFCGGVNISGNNEITLSPGTYIMDGGDFKASGSGKIIAKDVTIILTNSGASSYGSYGNLNITGDKDVYLSAPTSGDYNGVAVYQDRLADAGSSSNYNKLTGTSGLEVNGTVYTPKRQLDFGGSGKSSSDGDDESENKGSCTKIIANQVVFIGKPIIANKCDEFNDHDGNGEDDEAAKNIGNATARLIK